MADEGTRAPDVSPSFYYNQLAILAGTIIRYGRKSNARSLLDIGSGRIEVAYPISQSVDRYVGVEQDAEVVRGLRRVGLDVIEATFPAGLEALENQRFDLVVASHSIPEAGWQAYEPFLDRAWDFVAPSGVLLIITFKGAHDSPMLQVREELLNRTVEPDDRYTAMMERLATYGRVEVEKQRSHVTTDQFSDIGAFFGGLLWTSPEEERMRTPQLRQIADRRFREGERFCIPTDHLVIATSKRS